MKDLGHTAFYRLGQVCRQLGFVRSLTDEEQRDIACYLPGAGFGLFMTMSPADQRHALSVWQRLQERGCAEKDLLAAALLHDVGKAAGRVPFWTRPVIVLGRRMAPRLLARLAVYPDQALPRWRCALSNAWWHADVGANLAAEAGLGKQVVHYIRMHHRPDSPELTELHLVDEAS